MNLHEMLANAAYRLQAKGRHGTHSPFIYRLVAYGLRQPLPYPLRALAEAQNSPGLLPVQCLLLVRLLHYFGPARLKICAAPLEAAALKKLAAAAGAAYATDQAAEPGAFDALLLHYPPDLWAETLAANPVAENGFAAVLNIHASIQAEGAWKQLKAQNAVRASADFFRTGLLFFRPAFLQRRHFVLKFPA